MNMYDFTKNGVIPRIFPSLNLSKCVLESQTSVTWFTINSLFEFAIRKDISESCDSEPKS